VLFWKDSNYIKLMKNPNMLMLVMIGGVSAGVNSGWGGLLSQVLLDAGYSNNYIGITGFLCSISGSVGCILCGHIADKCFPKYKKGLLIIMFILATASFIWFQLSQPTTYFDEPPLSSTEYSTAANLIIAALFQGATDPLFYELAAEITYPLPEGISASMIVLIYNVATLVMLAVAPCISIMWVNTI